MRKHSQSNRSFETAYLLDGEVYMKLRRSDLNNDAIDVKNPAMIRDVKQIVPDEYYV